MESPTSHQHEECFSLLDIARKKLKSDDGFSGYLHAVTGVLAVQLIFLVGLLMGWGQQFATVGSLALVVAFALALIGATLYPDLDNSKSTSHSALGFVGEGISFVFRATSSLIQIVVRTPKDDASPNPHRGFYHTTLSAVLIGLGVWQLTRISLPVELPFLGEISLGRVFAIIFLGTMILLMLSALAKSRMKKIRGIALVGELVAFAISVVVASLLLSFIPAPAHGDLWLGIAIAAGGFVHILGDTFTRYGTPIFFPLAVFTKKRFWWYTRFGRIESGGEVEKIIVWVCLGLSLLIFLFCIGKVFLF